VVASEISLEGVKSAMESGKAVASSTLNLQFRMDGKTTGDGITTKIGNRYELMLTRTIDIDASEQHKRMVTSLWLGSMTMPSNWCAAP